ncbi:MAG: hypothetical protein IJT94_10770 [Oscillibacter sp.]|nr:hypothetical protein [Oscillibacter sp.]
MKKVSDFLGSGIPLTQRDLSAVMGYLMRSVRELIRTERLAGVPILSDNKQGYYMSEDREAVRRFCDSMDRRAREISAVADAIRRANLG